jgi:thioredoxin-dependent peroxiredoxin
MTNPEELDLGDLAPDFRLPSSAGGEVSLSDFRGKRHVVLFFVREFI